jgi:pilus assembly protein CpaB
MKLPLKLPQFNRHWLMLGGAVLLGLAALTLSHKLLHDHMAQLDAEERAAHKMVKVVVANRDVARGDPISAERFSVREVPVEYVHAAAIRPDRFNKVVGLRLGAPLKRGEPLLDVHLESTSMVFSSTLESGNRALTTEVDEVNSISGMLRPSDHIDLMATAHGSGNNSKEITFPLLANVEVLATGQVTRKADGGNQAHTYTTITLSVRPQDAQRIVVAKNSGKLTAVLRNPDDAQPGATAAMNIDDVLPKKPDGAKHVAVQYIIGGGRS